MQSYPVINRPRFDEYAHLVGETYQRALDPIDRIHFIVHLDAVWGRGILATSIGHDGNACSSNRIWYYK
jgi:hypothetical protein